MKELLKYIGRRLENCRNGEDLKDLRRDYALFLRLLDKLPSYCEDELIKAFVNEGQEEQKNAEV